MLNGKKIVVVMPAYNAERTLEKTYNDIYQDIVDEIILTDDKSVEIQRILPKILILQQLYIKKIKVTGETKKLVIKQH